MKKKNMAIAVAVVCIGIGGLFVGHSSSFAEEPKSGKSGTLNCQLSFRLESISFVIKRGSGPGTITCNNGISRPVQIVTTGGGFTIGKQDVAGEGKFTPVDSVSELYGSYAYGGAHGGIKESGTAQVVTKGDITLSFTAVGQGFDFGVDAGEFKIKKR